MPATATVPIRDASKAVQDIRKTLAAGGSSAVAAISQTFFRDPIRSYGWKTAPLRRFAHQWRRELLREGGIAFLVEVADQLFRPGFEEEKTFAIFLLEQSPTKLGEAEFRLFESWLDRVQNWSDHDGLTMYFDRADDVGEAAARKASPRMVKIVRCLASPRGGRFAHPRTSPRTVLGRGATGHQDAATRSRSDGPEGPRLDAARSRQSQSKPDDPIPDINSGKNIPTCAAYCVRDAGSASEREDSDAIAK